MISCYILAESSTIHALSAYTKQLFLPLKGFSPSFAEGFNSILSNRPDIVFIDIGFVQQHSQEMAVLKSKTSFVILSDHIGEAYSAFELQAFDFMLKPLDYGRFIRCIEKYSALADRLPFASKNDHYIQDSFFVKTDAKGLREMKIKYKDVVYVEAMQNYVTLHLENEKQYLIYSTMKEMEENLPSAIFSRIHKSFLINDNKVSYFEGNAVILNDNIKLKIVIGNTYRKVFIEKKNKIMIRGHRQKLRDGEMGGNLSISAVFIGLIGVISDALQVIAF
ncbi:MAG: response regulator transcription factor [Sphingobacteriales bacterium]|nr:MAG: response regulator transcription factor [Sphingobacteriales bacterium]